MKLNVMKRIGLMAILCAFLLTIASCGGISQSYADKINDAAKDSKNLTYEEVMKKLGDKNTVDLTIAVAGSHSGVVMGVKGCESWDDVQKKLEDGKEVKGIVVTILANKAMSAEYREITADDKK